MKKKVIDFRYAATAAVITVIYIFLSITLIANRSGSRLSLVDIYCLENVGCRNIETVIWTVLIINILKNDFRTNVIVRQQSIRRMFMGIWQKMLLISFVAAVFTLFASTVTGLLLNASWCNWDMIDSYAFYCTGLVTDASPDPLHVIPVYFVLKMCSLIFCYILVIIAWWRLRIPIAGLVIYLALSVFESAYEPLAVFFSYANMSWGYIYDKGVNFFSMIVMPLIFIAFMTVFYILILKKRDWLKA